MRKQIKGDDGMLTIRRAVYEDIPHIMKFMDEHWKPGNILAKDRSFFEWQFVEDGKCKYVHWN